MAAAIGAADPEYRAGTASFGAARALALEDRRGSRVVIAQAEFAVPRSLADFVAARLMRQYGLAREAVLLRGAGSAPASADTLATAAAAALGALDAAVVRFGDGALSVASAAGRCRGSFSAPDGLRLDGCRPGALVRSPVRAAFQMVEPPPALHERGEIPGAHPVQAIAFGTDAAILALGGEVNPGRFAFPGVIVTGFANDSAPLPEGAHFDAAVRALLKRVAR